jgi:hypothetical protein
MKKPFYREKGRRGSCPMFSQGVIKNNFGGCFPYGLVYSREFLFGLFGVNKRSCIFVAG